MMMKRRLRRQGKDETCCRRKDNGKRSGRE
jgi:hypothetical protein